MTLGEKQELFTRLFCTALVPFALSQNLGVVLDEAARGEAQAAWNASHCRVCRKTRSSHPKGHTFRAIGILESLHRIRLAADLLLFKRVNGRRVYLESTSAYAQLGAYWKSLHPLARWGGDFENPDGGHFSIGHGGRA